MEVTTSQAAAQASFDAALVYQAGYVWHRAEECLEAALALDPNLVMARAEMARVHLAQEELEEAQRRIAEIEMRNGENELPPRERAWIGLAVRQVQAASAPRGRRSQEHASYREALDRFLADFPRDVHGLTLRGNAEGPRVDDMGQTGGETSLPWYEKALDLDPEYLPALHYRAHSLENTRRYEEAVRSARRLVARAPTIPHSHHVLGHVLPRVGRWSEALAVLETAQRLHRAAFARGDVRPENDWHYSHNTRLLATVHLRLGHLGRARELLQELVHLDLEDAKIAYYCAPWLQFLLLQGEPETALSEARRCQALDAPLARLVGHTAAGEALLAQGRDPTEAALEMGQAYPQMQALNRDANPSRAQALYLQKGALALSVLQAKVAVEMGQPAKARDPLVSVADRLTAGSHFDAWASGWLRLAELIAYTHSRGETEIMAALLERMHELDPDFPAPGTKPLAGGEPLPDTAPPPTGTVDTPTMRP